MDRAELSIVRRAGATVDAIRGATAVVATVVGRDLEAYGHSLPEPTFHGVPFLRDVSEFWKPNRLTTQNPVPFDDRPINLTGISVNAFHREMRAGRFKLAEIQPQALAVTIDFTQQKGGSDEALTAQLTNGGNALVDGKVDLKKYKTHASDVFRGVPYREVAKAAVQGLLIAEFVVDSSNLVYGQRDRGRISTDHLRRLRAKWQETVSEEINLEPGVTALLPINK